MTYEEARSRFPAVAQRALRDHVEDLYQASLRAAAQKQADVVRLEAAEQRLDQIDQQRREARAAAKRQRSVAISRKQVELRRLGHAFAEDRAFAAHCIDDAPRVAAATAAHQARMAAAEQPAPKPAPTLRLAAPAYGVDDLQYLVSEGFGSRVS